MSRRDLRIAYRHKDYVSTTCGKCKGTGRVDISNYDQTASMPTTCPCCFGRGIVEYSRENILGERNA